MKLNHVILLSAALLAAVAFVATPLPLSAASPASLFINAPQSRFPFLPKMKRMDMVDYYNSGVGRGSDNLLGGKSRVLELTPEQIKVELVEGGMSTTSLLIVPNGKNDSIIVVVSNVLTPAPDGMISFYTTGWKEIKGKQPLFDQPTFDDWLVKGVDRSVRDDVRNAVPFVMAQYSFDPATGVLTLTQTADQYLPEAEYNVARDYLLKQLRYKWNGKKMEKLK